MYVSILLQILLPTLFLKCKSKETHAYWVSHAVQPSHPLALFSSCPQSFPASGSFPVSQLFVSGGQNIGISASASIQYSGLISCRTDWLDLLVWLPELNQCNYGRSMKVNSCKTLCVLSSHFKCHISCISLIQAYHISLQLHVCRCFLNLIIENSDVGKHLMFSWILV